MAIKQYKKIPTADKDLEKVQENTRQFAVQLVGVPLLDGVLLRDVSLVVGSGNKIIHKMGRVPIGYIVVDSSAATDICTSSKSTSHLTLNSSAAATVTIWVF